MDIIQKGLGQIQRSFERQIKAGKLTLEDANAAVGRIDTALSLEVGQGHAAPTQAPGSPNAVQVAYLTPPPRPSLAALPDGGLCH